MCVRACVRGSVRARARACVCRAYMVDFHETSTIEILTHTSGKNRFINPMWCSVNGAHRMPSWDTYFCIANSNIIAPVGEKLVILRVFCQSIP